MRWIVSDQLKNATYTQMQVDLLYAEFSETQRIEKPPKNL